MKQLHSIKSNIPPEFLDAARVLQAMYNRDYPPHATLWFYTEAHNPVYGKSIHYWCDRWEEDQRFCKADKTQWSVEELVWLQRHQYEYPEIINIPDLSEFFVEAP